MKYFLTIGLVVVMACFALTDGYALDLTKSSNGYDWNKATVMDKVAFARRAAAVYLVKPLADYNFWVRNLDEFYDTKESAILTATVDQGCDLIIFAHQQNEKARHKFGD